MTKNQKEILKKLGYEETDEEGAILEHSKYSYWDGLRAPRLDYVWKGDSFDYVLENYSEWLERCSKKMAITAIERSMN
jgi:hypothetical protein